MQKEMKAYKTSIPLVIKFILCVEELSCCEAVNFGLVSFSMWWFCFAGKYLPFIICDVFDTIQISLP